MQRRRKDQDLDEEMRAYIDLTTDEKINSGISPLEARRLALAEAGGIEPVKEAVRAVRSGAPLDQLFQDCRLALRTFRKAPAFTTVAVLTLALGIGANTAMFTMFRQVVADTLPVGEPDRIVE